MSTETSVEPIRGDRGGTILGPRNVPLERENPDLLASAINVEGLPEGKCVYSQALERTSTLSGRPHPVLILA
jgi:oxalate decarboxylase